MDQTLPLSTEGSSVSAPARIAIISTPRCGNTWLRHSLMTLYGVPSIAAHSPGELDWAALPPGVVLQMHWHPTPAFLELLERHRFQTMTLARHPLDVLLSILHFCMHDESTAFWLQGEHGNEDGIFAAMPCSAAFLDYATGPRAGALLSVSRAWWAQPGCRQLRYEVLVQDTHRTLGALVQSLGLPTKCSLEDTVAANSFSKLRTLTQASHHFWRGQPDQWKLLLPGALAQQIECAQEPVFSTFGYPCDPDPTLDAQQADANWIRLAREELSDRLRQLKTTERSMHSLRGELMNAEAALHAEKHQHLATMAEVAADRQKLLHALGDLAGERQKVMETSAQLAALGGRLEQISAELGATRERLAKFENLGP